jgi:hypothetical protein
MKFKEHNGFKVSEESESGLKEGKELHNKCKSLQSPKLLLREKMRALISSPN